MSSWDIEFYEVVHELDEARRKLRKADHDRQRYARRISFLQDEYGAIRDERDKLRTALAECERRLNDVSGGAVDGKARHGERDGL